MTNTVMKRESRTSGTFGNQSLLLPTHGRGAVEGKVDAEMSIYEELQAEERNRHDDPHIIRHSAAEKPVSHVVAWLFNLAMTLPSVTCSIMIR